MVINYEIHYPKKENMQKIKSLMMVTCSCQETLGQLCHPLGLVWGFAMTKYLGVLNWYDKFPLARQHWLIGSSFVRRVLRILRLCPNAVSVRGSVEGNGGRHEMFSAFREPDLTPSSQKQK